MKKIAYLILLLAGITSLLTANAQTNPVATSLPDNSTNMQAMPAMSVADTNADTVATTNEVSPAPTNEMTSAPTNEMASAVSAPVTNKEPSEAGASESMPNIPLIQFSDVPLTTAIESLARQAGINYMLDPKIGYGQPGPNGQIKAEPQLSIRWENITAEHALLALLDNYGLQLIVDKKTGIDRIVMKEPNAPPPLITRVVQLQYASVSNMIPAVQSAFTDKRSKVIADPRTSQMVVVATDPEQQAVDTLVKQLDKPTKQVLIEAKLIEISSNPTTTKGVDWSGTLQKQNIFFGNGYIDSGSSKTTVSTAGTSSTTQNPNNSQSITTTQPAGADTLLSLIQGEGGFAASTAGSLIPETAFLNADGVHAVLSFLNASYNAQIMSTPRIVTLDNETAEISVTRQYPVINFAAGTQNSSGSSSVTYSNVGTILQVTPHISANEKIWLKVEPEVSSHFGDQTVTIPGGSGNASITFPVPIFDMRKMTTQVLVPNGDTLVLGGLVQDNPTATYTKVPLLGDIPGLGWAFRSENKSMTKDNLLVFLTPSIVKDSDFQPAKSDFLQSKPITMKAPMDPHTMWDGAQPRGNWSNPAPSPGEFDNKPKWNNF